MKKIIFLLFSLFSFSFGYTQDTTANNVDLYLPSKYAPNPEKRISKRIGIGVQNHFYTEVGVALHKCWFTEMGPFANDMYTSLEWTPAKNNIYGLKIGYEANVLLLNIGMEVKYQTNFNHSNDFVITPKLGLGILNDVNLFYGYNISTHKSPFTEIGHHQFSFILNLNKHFLGKFDS